jgi:hypothetical protein
LNAKSTNIDVDATKTENFNLQDFSQTNKTKNESDQSNFQESNSQDSDKNGRVSKTASTHLDVDITPMEYYNYNPFKAKEKNQAEIFSKIERQTSSDFRKCSKE